MVAVIIPAYNNIELLERALNSLSAQSFKEFQVVVVDDFSSKELESNTTLPKLKYPIIWIRNKKNLGPALTRQNGLDWTYSQDNIKYIMFLDSDDILYPNAIGILHKTITENESDFVMSRIGIQYQDFHQAEYDETIKTFLHGKIYNKYFLYNNNITFSNIPKTNEDLTFNNKALLLSKNYKQIPCLTYLYTFNASSIARNSLSNDFIYVHSTDFIEATYQSVLFAYKNNIKTLPDHIIIDIIKSYNHYQIGLIKNKMITIGYKAKIQFMFQNPSLKNRMNQKTFIEKILPLISSGAILNEEIIFFEQTFKDWLEEMSK
jgi:glycosyltransferase involved in cell wall biosynthesis